VNAKKIFAVATIVYLFFFVANVAYSVDDGTKNVLKQGLLGAGTGAIASGASGGNAGTGALIGAGTGVIGGALLDAITEPSPSSSRRSPPPQQAQYYDDQDDYGDEPVYYEEPPQQSAGANVLKQGLLGAGTGAIASGMSGGSAGKGALIGAGAGAIGGVLLDMMTQPSQPKRVYRSAPVRQQPVRQQPQSAVRVQQPGDYADDTATGTSRKKIVRKYDDTGKVISEEEIYY